MPRESAVTQISFEVRWDAVENAASYVYGLDGGAEVQTTQTNAQFDGLEPGRDYTVRVKAVSGARRFLDSEFAAVTVTTQPATQLTPPVLEPGTATEQSAAVTWAAVPGANSYVFTIDGGAERTTAELAVDVTGLESGMPAAVRVKAISDQPQYLDSEFAELVVAAAMEPDPFVLTVPAADVRELRVSIVPKRAARTYYAGCATKEEYAKYASSEELVASVRSKFRAAALLAGRSYEEYLATQLKQGEQTLRFAGLQPDTEYIVYAVGWHAPYDLLTTPLATLPVRTAAEAACEVAVELTRVTAEGFDIVCTPDENVGNYYVYVVKTNSLTMEQLMAGGLEGFKKNVMTAKEMYTGAQTIEKTGLASGTRYSVCIYAIGTNGSDFYVEKTQMTAKAE